MATKTNGTPAVALDKFRLYDVAIADMREQYMGLVCTGIEDKEGFKAVHEARMIVKAKRVEVEKTRKELKADALEYGRKVDAEAKRITALLEPIESHLLKQEEAVEAEKERIRNAARLKAEAEARAIEEARLAKEKAEREAEQERLRIEREKLAAERRALEAEMAKMEAERRAAQEKIDAERRALEDEQRKQAEIEAKRKRENELEKARVEAAERAKRETEARIAREAAAKAEAERIAAEQKRRQEALRPDREKLLAVANFLGDYEVPEVSEEAEHFADEVRTAIKRAADQIRSIVRGM